jgi:hypothetical protein
MTHPTSTRPGPPRLDLVRAAVVALLFTAAPVAGDIGSCAQEAEDLDATLFFTEKEEIDCRRCEECDIATGPCVAACSPGIQTEFLPGCYPLVHDGEVCLNALDAASCSDYTLYMADSGGFVPTECNFCPAAPEGE